MTDVQTNPLEDLVQHALDQDYNKANQIFGDLMGTKITDVLDQEKIRLADQIYNGMDEDEGEEDDDQLELDLEDDETESEDETEEDYEDDDEDEELVITDEDFEETEEE